MDFKSIKKWLLCITYGLILFFLLYRFNDVVQFAKTGISILFPFLIGCFLAFILNLPMRAIERKLPAKLGRWRRPISLVLTLLLFVSVFFITISMVVPALTDTFQNIAASIPVFVDRIIVLLEENNISSSFFESTWITDILERLDSELVSLISSLSAGLISSTVGIISFLIQFFTTAAISLVFAIYILFSKETLVRQLKMLLFAHFPRNFARRTVKVARLTQNTFSNFFSGQFVEACILGTMFVISMSIFKIPYAILIGLLIALTALIPIFGAFIGCITGVLLIIIESPLKAILFVILFFILQQLEGNLIYPKVVGNSVGLPSIWVLVAVTTGGNLFGIAGMLFFIPIFSVVYNLLRESTWKQLRVKKFCQKDEKI